MGSIIRREIRVLLQLAHPELPVCPACQKQIETGGAEMFKCPHCSTLLRAQRPRGYWTIRVIVCFGTAAIWAWKRGWDASFVIFVVAFYAIPVMIAWGYIQGTFFPSKRYEAIPPAIQKLGL